MNGKLYTETMEKIEDINHKLHKIYKVSRSYRIHADGSEGLVWEQEGGYALTKERETLLVELSEETGEELRRFDVKISDKEGHRRSEDYSYILATSYSMARRFAEAMHDPENNLLNNRYIFRTKERKEG